MYQSQAVPMRTGCFGCYGGFNTGNVQPYGYDQYNQYNQYGQYGQYPGAALTTSVVAPVNVGQVPLIPSNVGMLPPNPMDVQGIYTSRTIQAPPVINKAVVAVPACMI